MTPATMPDWLEPMAATLTHGRISGSDWSFERKVRPELVVQVAFLEWTVHDKLRHPRLVGVRVDKDARDVTSDRP